MLQDLDLGPHILRNCQVYPGYKLRFYLAQRGKAGVLIQALHGTGGARAGRT